jgi:hypothetical protein
VPNLSETFLLFYKREEKAWFWVARTIWCQVISSTRRFVDQQKYSLRKKGKLGNRMSVSLHRSKTTFEVKSSRSLNYCYFLIDRGKGKLTKSLVDQNTS